MSQDTKGEDARIIYLAPRALEAIRQSPRRLGSPYVFVNPKTAAPWVDVRTQFLNACRALRCLVSQLRRSFLTNARRCVVPESVVMRMSGHKTRAVFERYNVVAEEDLRDAIERIEGARLRQETVKVSKVLPEDSKAPSASAERA